MRLLDRYLLRELLIPFGYCLVGFLIFWIAFDVFAELGNFQKYKLTVGDVLTYYVVKTPEVLVTVLPVAFLLALLYALTNHARHHELTAMRAAGVSLLRLSVPYLGVGFLLSCGVLAMNELWVTESQEAAAQVLARHKAARNTGQTRQWEQNLCFYNHRDRRTWVIDSYNLETAEMLRPHVVWQQPDGGKLEMVAERGWLVEGIWVFTNLHLLRYPPTPGALPGQEQLESRSMPDFTETPEQIRSEIKINKLNSFKAVRRTQLSILEILEYKRLHPGGTNYAMLDTKLHGRLASPWTCLVVVLIALPFGAATGRRNVFVGVASSIVICFAYFVLLQLALALGTRGTLLPWVAAWAPNAIFGIGGILLTRRVR